ncbi:hypothetical protein MLD38_017830 [Melastoma candidum]|uniref:Uncharacterized protein n=1 Tax=Melastoma candidum TaxID=119954 RepID=A0ACB9QRV2_9MYRT|nr:hypothetical protein MLD38_017830 [Melastoma candidum]
MCGRMIQRIEVEEGSKLLDQGVVGRKLGGAANTSEPGTHGLSGTHGPSGGTGRVETGLALESLEEDESEKEMKGCGGKRKSCNNLGNSLTGVRAEVITDGGKEREEDRN